MGGITRKYRNTTLLPGFPHVTDMGPELQDSCPWAVCGGGGVLRKMWSGQFLRRNLSGWEGALQAENSTGNSQKPCLSRHLVQGDPPLGSYPVSPFSPPAHSPCWRGGPSGAASRRRSGTRGN